MIEDTVAVGDEAAFAGLSERYRPELRVHCYRMVGSLEESEDLVQETFLRAWRKRETCAGRSTFRAWLYRIATNACLDALDRRARDPLASPPGPPPPAAVKGLDPCPDSLLDAVASQDAEPGAVVVAKETIELAFLAAIQQLPPRQRAVVIMRDALGWHAAEIAEMLETTSASVNSALQRARPALKRHLPEPRTEWAPPADPSAGEREVLERYMAAIERSDDAALGALLREDVRCGQQPGAGGNMTAEPVWYTGRDTLLEAWAPALHGDGAVESRLVATRANRQPAMAMYARMPGETAYRAFGLTVLRIVDGLVAEVSVFHPDLFPAFGLAPAL